jgi:predicted transcriptional regulator
MRITIDLPEDVADALASLATRLVVSRVELIGQALAA